MTLQNSKKISVLLVDDHPPIRAGIRNMLEKTPDIFVVGEAENGSEAEHLLAELRPRIILLDLVMPGFSPYAFEKWARENYPETVTLVLTAHDRDAFLANMIEAGAVGYLDKNVRAGQLVEAIHNAARGASYFTDEQIARAQKWKETVKEKWESLTNREREILQHLVMSEDNKMIAKSLSISTKTVEFHITNILKKLNIHTREEAIVWMLKHQPDDPSHPKNWGIP